MTETLSEQIEMGREAGLLKDNPAYARAIDHLRAGCYERLKECPLKDKEGLTLIVQQLKVVNALEAAVTGLIEKGSIAANEWQRLNSARSDGPVQRAIRRIA